MNLARLVLILAPAMFVTSCSARRESAPASATLSLADSTPLPATVAEAARLTVASMTEAERNTMRVMPRGDVPSLLHGFQMSVRHSFGLSDRTNVALLRSCGSELMPLEECLLVILDAAWLQLQKQ